MLVFCCREYLILKIGTSFEINMLRWKVILNNKMRTLCSTVIKAITDAELKIIENNIIIRQHKNNVGLIRELLDKLENDCGNLFIKEQFLTEVRNLPNTTHHRIVTYGNKPQILLKYNPETKCSHTTFAKICKDMNFLRTEHLTNFTGHKSYYLMGFLAELEQILVKYTLEFLQSHNFQLLSVPDILPKEIINACGMQTEGERTQVYELACGSCLSGTAEMALAGFYKNKIFKEEDLPINVAAVSRCYRAETSGLQEEKGIYRVHQFTKVEMFSVCSEAQSEHIFDMFKDLQIEIFKHFGIRFRLLDMPPTELGPSAHRKYDIEAWMQGKQMWGEISSCSNCTNYQAKRLNLRYRTKYNKTKFAHTVNGTAAAIPRLIISAIESNQIEDDNISMPSLLKQCMRGKKLDKNNKMPVIKLIKFIKR